jgi:flagellar FliL protein
MKTSRLIGIVAIATLLTVSAVGAAAWFVLKPQLSWQGKTSAAGTAGKPSKEISVDTRAYRYVSMEKVIVMLRNTAGEPVSHYLAIDVVFMTPNSSEKVAREHLPLLRSVTVKALSQLTMDTASHLTVEELTQQINAAYTQAYVHDAEGKPFTEAMISKLIIE